MVGFLIPPNCARKREPLFSNTELVYYLVWFEVNSSPSNSPKIYDPPISRPMSTHFYLHPSFHLTTLHCDLCSFKGNVSMRLQQNYNTWISTHLTFSITGEDRRRVSWVIVLTFLNIGMENNGPIYFSLAESSHFFYHPRVI